MWDFPLIVIHPSQVRFQAPKIYKHNVTGSYEILNLAGKLRSGAFGKLCNQTNAVMLLKDKSVIQSGGINLKDWHGSRLILFFSQGASVRVMRAQVRLAASTEVHELLLLTTIRNRMHIQEGWNAAPEIGSKTGNGPSDSSAKCWNRSRIPGGIRWFVCKSQKTNTDWLIGS